MQTFTDSHGDEIRVANMLDEDGELLVETEMGDTVSFFYFNEETARALGAAIYAAAGGSTAAPVLASTISLNEGLLRLATVHGRQVKFRYQKDGSPYIESRAFKPSSCTGEGEHFRFTGYDPDRGATRAYRLDRIKGTVELVP